jgi:hypothetical protein
MSSLAYADEHFAWQQRIMKETTAFNSSYDTRIRSKSFDSTRRTSQSKEFGTPIKQSNPSRADRKRETWQTGTDKFKNEDFNTGYAFGGTTHIKNAANPLLKRPSTQGSYKPIARAQRRSVEKSESEARIMTKAVTK